MDVTFLTQDTVMKLNFNKVCTILGDNENSKTIVLNMLRDGFEGGLDSQFMVDNINVARNEYEVLYFTDDEDFESVFKFTKTNLYKKCLYQQIFADEIKVKAKDTMTSFVENIGTINQKMDAYFHNTVHFKTQLDNIEDFISENTVVYMGEQPLKLSGKYYKRMLLFQLISFYIRHSEREKIVIFIEDIDSYFSESSLLVVCHMLLELTKGRGVYFIITGSSPFLYMYFNERDSCYRIKGKRLYQLVDLEGIAGEVFVRVQYYMQQNYSNALQDYIKNNLKYITVDDIQYVLLNYFIPNIDRVGRLFCNDKVLIANSPSSNTLPTIPLISYTNLYERELFSVICDHLGIDKIIQ